MSRNEHQRAKASSAYFPSSMHSSVVDQPVHSVDPTLDTYLNNVPSTFTFPQNSTVLWDRTQVAKAIGVSGVAILPSVLLVPRVIRTVLHGLSSGSPFEVSAELSHRSQLNEIEKSVACRPYVGNSFVYSVRDFRSENSSGTLTIPVAPILRGGDNSEWDSSSTKNMMANLGKTIRKSREFALKSCMRLRAQGRTANSLFTAHDVNSSLSSNNGSCTISGEYPYSGTLHMEAIFPNASFRFTPIRPIGFMNTVLSDQLTKSDSPAFSNALKMGYLTMNATRKLVPVLETDPAVSTVNMVGLWVKHDAPWATQLLQQGEVDQVLRHPFVWGACVRYMCTEWITARVAVAPETFLMVLVVGSQLLYFEVTETADSGWAGEGPRLSTPPEFLRADFTVDLVVDDSCAGEAAEAAQSILGVFRPTRAPTPMSPGRFPESPLRTSSNAPPAWTGPVSAPTAAACRPSPSSGQYRVDTSRAGALEGSSVESGSILAPRARCPLPLSVTAPISPGKVAAGVPARRDAELVRQSQDSAARHSGEHPLYAERFVHLEREFAASRDALARLQREASQRADLVLSLQAELIESRKYIFELQRRLLACGGQLPEEGWDRQSSPPSAPVLMAPVHSKQSADDVNSSTVTDATAEKKVSNYHNLRASTTRASRDSSVRQSPASNTAMRASTRSGGDHDAEDQDLPRCSAEDAGDADDSRYNSCEEDGYWEREYEEEPFDPAHDDAAITATAAKEAALVEGPMSWSSDDEVEHEVGYDEDYVAAVPADTSARSANNSRIATSASATATAVKPLSAGRTPSGHSAPAAALSSAPSAHKGNTATAQATMNLSAARAADPTSSVRSSSGSAVLPNISVHSDGGHVTLPITSRFDDFEGSTFMESDSILRIQARYMHESE